MDYKKIQEIELIVMKSVFPEQFEMVEPPTNGGNLLIYAYVSDDFEVKWEEPDGKGGQLNRMKLQHLPPIALTVRFPINYPLENPPDFTLRCDWLDERSLGTLCEAMVDKWETTRNVILYEWALFLRDESMKFLHFSSELDITALYEREKRASMARDPPSAMAIGGILTSEIRFEVTFPDAWELLDDFREFIAKVLSRGIIISEEEYPDPLMIKLDRLRRSIECLPEFLRTHNDNKKLRDFNHMIFDCNVCLLTKSGKRCVRFHPCGHVFCKDCVKSYLEITINEGRVEGLHCLELDCSSPVMPSLVQELMSSDLFNTYDKKLYEISLSIMGDVIFCPRPTCQKPVLFDSSEPMAICFACDYVFCHHCRMVYHGLEQCRVKSSDKENLVALYLSSTEAGKKDLEKKYGKRPLQFLVDCVLSQKWIENNSKACPQCKANIEKRDGCNKMKCWRCMASFCWICRKLLTSTNPYDHFLDGTTRCYGKLFQ